MFFWNCLPPKSGEMMQLDDDVPKNGGLEVDGPFELGDF